MLPRRNASPRTKVLVIDDDPLMGRFLLRALAQEYDVVVEEDPLHALADLLYEPSYDVVLCDVQMPSASGPEILSALVRAGSPIVSRFVFMTTGAAELVDRPRTFGRPTLQKPIALVELFATVRVVAREGKSPVPHSLAMRDSVVTRRL